MTEIEAALLERLQKQGALNGEATWEVCRSWLSERQWKINVLSDYPRDEIKFSVRKGFERIEVSGKSDVEVMLRAMIEISHREMIHKEA